MSDIENIKNEIQVKANEVIAKFDEFLALCDEKTKENKEVFDVVNFALYFVKTRVDLTCATTGSANFLNGIAGASVHMLKIVQEKNKDKELEKEEKK